jgi:hypothetical protein
MPNNYFSIYDFFRVAQNINRFLLKYLQVNIHAYEIKIEVKFYIISVYFLRNKQINPSRFLNN